VKRGIYKWVRTRMRKNPNYPIDQTSGPENPVSETFDHPLIRAAINSQPSIYALCSSLITSSLSATGNILNTWATPFNPPSLSLLNSAATSAATPSLLNDSILTWMRWELWRCLFALLAHFDGSWSAFFDVVMGVFCCFGFFVVAVYEVGDWETHFWLLKRAWGLIGRTGDMIDESCELDVICMENKR